MPDPSRRWRRIWFAFALLTYLTTAFYAAHYGFDTLLWDDSEYVTQALDTSDHVVAYGLPSWLDVIARAQHYGKPPLYVNSLALFIHLVGRARIPLAIGLLCAFSAALVGIAVFSIVRRFASFWLSILAMLSIAGMPAVARWSPTAYPDMQLVLCVVWVIAILLADASPVWLGIALAAGVLAKTTFPFFVALPLVYWWWLAKDARPARTRELLKAGVIAVVVSALWYLPNIGEALAYARSSYSNSYTANPTLLGTISSWLRVTVVDGLGITILALAALTLLISLLPRHRNVPPFPRIPVIMLLAGGLPVFLIALASPWPDSRHLLPSFTLFTLAFLLTAFWVTRASRASGLLLALLATGVLGQWTLTKLTEIPRTAVPLQNSAIGQKLYWLLPALTELQPASTEAVSEVINQAEAMGHRAPARWYLSGNDGFFNVPRLQLAARVRRLPITFQWAEYFKWPEEQVILQLAAIAKGSAILLVAHPLINDSLGVYLAHNTQIVQQHLTDFRLLGAGSYVSLYATQHAYVDLSAPAEPLFADFSGYIDLSAIKVTGRTLTLRAKLLLPLSCKYMLMIHAFAADEQLRIWDRKPDPPLCNWQPGEVRMMSFDLPEEYLQQPYRLQIGFFDGSDREHGWPPLKIAGGGNFICVPSSDPSKAQCPVGLFAK